MIQEQFTQAVIATNYLNINNMKIGFLGLLGLVFIVLKLTNVIDWSWWWVTFPLWIGIALAIFFYVIVKLIVLPIWKLYNIKFHKEEYEYMEKLTGNKNQPKASGLMKRIQKAQEKQAGLIKERKENDK